MKIGGILKHKPIQTALLILLVGLSVFLRIFRLSADPPYFLTFSRGPFSDEGFKLYEARNLILFGKTRPLENDRYRGCLKTDPIPVLLGLLVFRIFGVGFVQARIVSVVASLLSLYLFFRILSRYLSPVPAYIGTLLLGVNFLYVSYNRMGIFETHMIFFLILTVYLWGEGRRRRILGMLAGIGALLVQRFQATLFLPVLILSFLGDYWRRKKTRPLAILAGCGAVAVAILVLAFLFFTYGERFPQTRYLVRIIRARLPETRLGLLQAAISVVANSPFLYGMPIVALLGLCGLPGVVKRLFEGGWQRERLLFILWLLIGFCGVALLGYRPGRYYLFLIPPLIALAVEVWDRLLKKEQIFGIKGLRGLLLSAIWAFFICFTLVIFALRQGERNYEMSYYLGARQFFEFEELREYFRYLRENPLAVLLLAGVLWVLWVGVFVLWPRIKRREGKWRAGWRARREFFAILLIVLAFLVQGWYHTRYISQPRYSLRRSSRALAKLTSDTPEPVIGGNWALALAMETDIMVFPLSEKINSHVAFRTFPVTHLLLEKEAPEEEIFMFEKYPQEMNKAQKIAELRAGLWTVCLYKLAPR